MDPDKLHEIGLAAAKQWRLANGIRDNSGGLSTMGSYKAYGRAVARAAWDEGRGSLAMDIASPMREDMTKRSTENPYRAADKENPA